MWTTIIFLLFATSFVTAENAYKNVLKRRNSLLEREIDMMLGSHIDLSDSESKVNEIIMDLKTKTLDQGFDEPQTFNTSKHFFEYKEEIKKTKLFKIINKMPKGAMLHVHDTAILGSDYILNLTYYDFLYVCFDDQLRLTFSEETPDLTCGTQWQLMRDARYSSGNIEKFDADLKKYFTIVIDNPNVHHTDINKVWSAFFNFFITTGPLFSYREIWEQYFYDAMKALRDDGIMYVEIRTVLPPLYDLEGNVTDAIGTAQSLKNAIDRFVKDYPDFHGAKFIYAPLRMVDKETVKEYIKTAKELKRKFPDFFAGFDLVGQEDLGAPIKNFLAELSEAKVELDYFFHAGETNWYGMSTDENLVDAIALGTKRIGHGFALAKHPHFIQEVMKRNIAIEVNVVSNNVLKLIDDVRNHPVASFLAQGLPVVLSGDDPGAWDAEPLTHDFYVTFVGVASRHADLKMLKQLALNSLYYSAIKNKDKILYDFEIRWAKFIDSVVKDTL